MLKIRRFCDRLIFNMGILIPGKDRLYWDRAQVTTDREVSGPHSDDLVDVMVVSQSQDRAIRLSHRHNLELLVHQLQKIYIDGLVQERRNSSALALSIYTKRV